MIVVDASAVVAFFLREDEWREIAPFMVQTISIDHVVKEFYNALWRSMSQRKAISEDDAREILALFESYRKKNMTIEPEEKYMEHSFEIASRHNVTVYDALYIAQALQHNKPLLTLDEKQRTVASRVKVKVLP
ncbi:MAG: type II toxin-antitoxin system VapC family toxin [Candidatus Nezhaarchaeota archaeon]|nr:type II toxin-antitoxin system VapC family toxin [Candidatus Nezhaarchaeota archaeon]